MKDFPYEKHEIPEQETAVLHSTATWAPSSFTRPTLQQFHHPYVVGIRRIVVLRNVVVLLRSLQDERDPAAAWVLHEPLERLLANESVPYEDVSILVGTKLTRAVVQMEKGRSLAGRLLEFVEHGG